MSLVPIASTADDAFVVHMVAYNQPMADALCQIVEGAGWTCHSYISGKNFLETYRPGAVECVLIDSVLQDTTGVEFERELIRRRYRFQMLLVAAKVDPVLIVDALKVGASDIVLRPIVSTRLIEQIKSAFERDRVINGGAFNARLFSLTPRERETLDQLLEAASTKQIANRLNIKPKTVEKHRESLLRKFHVESVPELMILFFRT